MVSFSQGPQIIQVTVTKPRTTSGRCQERGGMAQASGSDSLPESNWVALSLTGSRPTLSKQD